jgi:hypothetical protein
VCVFVWVGGWLFVLMEPCTISMSSSAGCQLRACSVHRRCAVSAQKELLMGDSGCKCRQELFSEQHPDSFSRQHVHAALFSRSWQPLRAELWLRSVSFPRLLGGCQKQLRMLAVILLLWSSHLCTVCHCRHCCCCCCYCCSAAGAQRVAAATGSGIAGEQHPSA